MSDELRDLLAQYLVEISNAEDTRINKELWDCGLYLLTMEIEVIK